MSDAASDGICPRCVLEAALLGPPEELEAALELPVIGRRIGEYEILGEIARGGMGIVFRARQQRPQRIVALKVIACGELATPRMIDRFRIEAQAAARLDHPNIVPIYEVGHDKGWHFFSMRLIEGCTLQDKVRGEPLPPREAAQLMVTIARAVHHAHERGVLHRDLKLTNILLDAKGEPHLTDFGLAKMVEGSLDLTASNAALGTPAYMAPEQALGSSDVTLSADVYGLGAVLYEMLTGRPPFVAPTAHALMRMLVETEPIPPSQVHNKQRRSGLRRSLQSAAVGKQRIDQLLASSASANALFSDLDAICLKCLEKEPTLRYTTAAALAADLELALRGETIVAKPSTTTQRCRKWMQRNPGKVAVALGFTCLLITATVVSAWQALRATAAEREQTQLRVAEERARRAAEAQTYAADINLAQQSLAQNNLGRARDLLLLHRPQPGEPDLREWEWRHLLHQSQSDAAFELRGFPQSVTSMDVSRNGRFLAAGHGVGGGLVVFDLTARKEVFRQQSEFSRVYCAFAATPSRSLLAYTASTGSDPARPRHFVRFWDPEGQPVPAGIELPGRCDRIAISPDERTLLTIVQGANNQIILWDLPTGAMRAAWPFQPQGDTVLTHSADLSTALVAEVGGRLRRLNLRDGSTVWDIVATAERLTAIGLSSDGKVVATAAGYGDSTIRLWSGDTGKAIGKLEGHSGYAHHLAFMAGDTRLVSASSDQTLRVWDLASQESLSVLRGHQQEVWRFALLPNEQTLVSGSKDGVILGWDLKRRAARRGRTILPHASHAWAFESDGKAVLLAQQDGVVSRWSGPQFDESRVLWNFGTNIVEAAFSGDAARLAVQLPGRVAAILDLRGERLISQFPLPPGSSQITDLNHSGDLLHIGNYEDPDNYEWDIAANEPTQVWHATGPGYADSALSPSGRWRLVPNVTGGITVRDLVGRTTRFEQLGITQTDAAAFAHDDSLVAVTSLEGYVGLWEWPSARPVGTLRGFLQGAHSAVFFGRGRRLAAGSNGRQALKIWDLATWRELITLEGEGSMFLRIRYSADEKTLGARNSKGYVHLWHAPTLSELGQ
ncbi:MAG TPA: serine/threonine-protein kinase [Methylomirabilota bacterium]|nr:serine/threonine-protein kinase [Methylomirabilota bacterium]